MARALSLELRDGVIAAIEAGASCQQTAERFGVSKASAVCRQPVAKQLGGDRHSHCGEVHAALIAQTI